MTEARDRHREDTVDAAAREARDGWTDRADRNGQESEWADQQAAEPGDRGGEELADYSMTEHREDALDPREETDPRADTDADRTGIADREPADTDPDAGADRYESDPRAEASRVDADGSVDRPDTAETDPTGSERARDAAAAGVATDPDAARSDLDRSDLDRSQLDRSQLDGSQLDGSAMNGSDRARYDLGRSGTSELAGDGQAGGNASLVADAGGLMTRWQEVQTSFVDDPRQALQAADGLVQEVLRQVHDRLTGERSTLEGQWSRGEDVSTEELRQALQQYRSFFNRLLQV